jgi:hypothetical protein
MLSFSLKWLNVYEKTSIFFILQFYFFILDSIRSYIQVGKLLHRDILKSRQFFWHSVEARNSEKASDLCRLQLSKQQD